MTRTTLPTGLLYLWGYNKTCTTSTSAYDSRRGRDAQFTSVINKTRLVGVGTRSMAAAVGACGQAAGAGPSTG